MNRNGPPPSLAELRKVAALNKREKRRQVLQYTALGAASMPAITAISNVIQKGKALPEGVKSVPRWLAGSMAAGALLSGAVPVVRDQLNSRIQSDALARQRKAEKRRLAKTAGVERLGAVVDKVMSAGLQQRAASVGFGATLGVLLAPLAASLTGNPESAKDTLNRDMIAGAIGGAFGGMAAGPAGGAVGGTLSGLVSGLFDKKGSDSGQDLRSPMMGHPKFPTNDSIRPAQKKLHQASAEVGPQPAPTFSMVGKMKQAESGDAMDPMMNDPLVLFLKQAAVEETAKEQPPLTGLLDSSNRFKDNLDDMPLGKEEHELTSACPCPTEKMESRSKSQVQEMTSDLFVNSRATRKKYDDKDHDFEGFDQGVVDRILGL